MWDWQEEGLQCSGRVEAVPEEDEEAREEFAG